VVVGRGGAGVWGGGRGGGGGGGVGRRPCGTAGAVDGVPPFIPQTAHGGAHAPS